MAHIVSPVDATAWPLRAVPRLGMADQPAPGFAVSRHSHASRSVWEASFPPTAQTRPPSRPMPKYARAVPMLGRSAWLLDAGSYTAAELTYS